jgi:hypothetical protein
VRGSAEDKGEVEQPQEKQTPRPKTQGEILADIKKNTRTDITTREDKQALPRSIVECLAKWVVCHDKRSDNKDKRSNVVWDTTDAMKTNQDIWKERQMCVGPPCVAADVGGGARSHHYVGRKPLATRKIGSSKDEAGKAFCYFGTHREFKNF